MRVNIKKEIDNRKKIKEEDNKITQELKKIRENNQEGENIESNE